MKKPAGKIRQNIALVLLAMTIPVLVWSGLTMESRALFHPESTFQPEGPWDNLTASFGSSVQNIDFHAKDGTRVNGAYIPAKNGMPTVIFAHGNGGHMGDRMTTIRAFTERGYGFLAFDYRGYAKSDGVPSEKGLYQDMEAASTYLTQKAGIPPSKQIALGESLGSAVVIEAATHIPFKAVMVYSALTTTPEVATHILRNNVGGLFSILPTEMIIQQRFDSLSRIEKVKSPLLVIHGKHDLMMPTSMGETLWRKAGSKHKKFMIVEDADHNTIFSNGGSALVDALEELLKESGNS